MGCLTLHTSIRISTFATLLLACSLIPSFAQQDTIIANMNETGMYLAYATEMDGKAFQHEEMTTDELASLQHFVVHFEDIRPRTYDEGVHNNMHRSLSYRRIFLHPESIDSTRLIIAFISEKSRLKVDTLLLLYADVRYVVLSRTFQHDDMSNPIVIQVSDIVSISVENSIFSWKGFTWGSLVIGIPLITLGEIIIHSDKYPPESGQAMLFAIGATFIIAIPVGIITGFIWGLLDSTDDYIVIDKDSWVSDVLPDLQKLQFYRRGLTLELLKKLYTK